MGRVIQIEFAEGIYSLSTLSAASYRLVDVASCQIEKMGDKFVCILTPKESGKVDEEALRLRFIDHVTDESVRERLAPKLEPVRNLILSLAFGALVGQPQKQG